jgi:hypothetical protein
VYVLRGFLNSRPREEFDGFGDYGRWLRNAMAERKSRLHVHGPRCPLDRDCHVEFMQIFHSMMVDDPFVANRSCPRWEQSQTLLAISWVSGTGPNQSLADNSAFRLHVARNSVSAFKRRRYSLGIACRHSPQSNFAAFD